MAEASAIVKCASVLKQNYKPGDYAEQNSWCASGKRNSDGICVGNMTNDPCKTDVDCDVGLYCNLKTLVCQEAIEEGYPCTNGAKCQSYLTCFNNTCTKYGHIAAGVKPIFTASKDNCQTHYYDYSTRTCEHGPVLTSPMFNDQPNVFCNYSYKGKTIVDSPACRYSTNGSLLCSQKEGGLENNWNALLAYMQKKPKCHVLHRYAFCDNAQNIGCDDYLDGLHAYYLIEPMVYTSLQDMPTCVKNWVFKQYWYPECGRRSGAIALSPVLALAALAILLLL